MKMVLQFWQVVLTGFVCFDDPGVLGEMSGTFYDLKTAKRSSYSLCFHHKKVFSNIPGEKKTLFHFLMNKINSGVTWNTFVLWVSQLILLKLDKLYIILKLEKFVFLRKKTKKTIEAYFW